MRTARTKAELRDLLAGSRRDGRTIGIVPTMGGLHEGHLSLLRAARTDCDVVVMTLFVNPTQFAPSEDLSSYPRDEARDARLAEVEGVDFIYAPPFEEVYPDGFATAVTVEGLTDVLCGDPGRRGASHFRGVTTVVAKLLNTVSPDVAYFGQKDAQQAVVIKRMVGDLDFDVRIEVLPIVREPDGLAMSSRNVYLSDGDRVRALSLSRALEAARERALAGSLDEGIEAARAVLEAAGVEPEYLEARDAETLAPVAELNGRPALLAVAAKVGPARLIDNVLIRKPNQNPLES